MDSEKLHEFVSEITGKESIKTLLVSEARNSPKIIDDIRSVLPAILRRNLSR